MTNEQPKEVWRDIPTLPEGYQASDMGRVRSFRRCGKARERLRAIPMVRKAVPNCKTGYLTMMFVIDGKYVLRYVHQLVLEAFGFKRPNAASQVRHLNRDYLDNKLTNICWGTPTENAEDARFHGTLTCGERNGGVKLTNVEARQIKDSTEMGCVLAKRYNVAQSAISKIRHGLAYKDA